MKTDPVEWLAGVIVAVAIVVAFVVIANTLETRAVCRERGGVMVYDRFGGVCLRSDAVEVP